MPDPLGVMHLKIVSRTEPFVPIGKGHIPTIPDDVDEPGLRKKILDVEHVPEITRGFVHPAFFAEFYSIEVEEGTQAFG